MLEYYEGIMFLTTNRISTIDPAFLSRIHLAIHYQQHTGSTRQALWRTFIEGVSANGKPAWLTDDAISRLASYSLNGRQIRNCMRIACALANGQGRDLSFEDLEAASKSTLEFSGTLSSHFEDDRLSESEAQRTMGKSRKRPRMGLPDEDGDITGIDST